MIPYLILHHLPRWAVPGWLLARLWPHALRWAEKEDERNGQ